MLCAAGLFFAAAVLQPFESVQPHMGTLFRIQLYTETPDQAKAAFEAAFARMAQLDAELSDYQASSELSRVTQNPPRMPVHISSDLFTVLAASQKIARATHGAFDVTLGPLTHLWRTARRERQVPAPEEVAAALQRCGYRKMHLNRRQQTVSFDRSGMLLDVGGIAKGYAADEALAVLTRLGIRSALVAASGDLTFSEAPPGEKGWKIGVASNRDSLYLVHAAVSTAGAESQSLSAGGVRYSHIIDPRTGLGLTTNLTTTVIAPRGIDADGLDTALNVLGPRRTARFLKRRAGILAIFTYPDGVQSTFGRSVPNFRF